MSLASIAGSPATGAMTMSVMIVAYNSRNVIEDCLASVFSQSVPGGFEVLLIDNGEDGTGEWVGSRFPAVRVIPSRGNIGFGSGNNVLSHEALGEYLLLLNPDTVVEPNAFRNLLAFAQERADGAAWGGVITSLDGTPDVSNYIALPTLSQFAYAAVGLERLLVRKTRDTRLDQVRRVDALCGAFFLIRTDRYRRLGGFDESFFLYSEEVDLFARIREQGDPVYASPDAVVRHMIGMTGTMTRARSLYKTKGMMHFARKHWRGPKAVLAGVLIWIASFERSVIGLMKRDRQSRVAVMGKASWIICARPQDWWRGYGD